MMSSAPWGTQADHADNQADKDRFVSTTRQSFVANGFQNVEPVHARENAAHREQFEQYAHATERHEYLKNKARGSKTGDWVQAAYAQDGPMLSSNQAEQQKKEAAQQHVPVTLPPSPKAPSSVSSEPARKYNILTGAEISYNVDASPANVGHGIEGKFAGRVSYDKRAAQQNASRGRFNIITNE